MEDSKLGEVTRTLADLIIQGDLEKSGEESLATGFTPIG